jgi:hypothetical protein
MYAKGSPIVKLSVQQRRTALSLLTGAGVGVLVTVVFLLTAGWSSRVAALAATVMFLSLAAPCLSIAVSGSGDVRLWSWLVLYAGCAAGALVAASLTYPSAVPAAAASLVVVGAAAFCFGVLAVVIGKAARAPRVGAVASSCCLLVLVATPFWSRGVMHTAFGVRHAALIIGSSPYLASAMPWVGLNIGWSFDPKTGSVLYDLWIGNDFPVTYPSWYACAIGYLLAGAGLILVSELTAAAFKRWRTRPNGPDSTTPPRMP